jgi:SAM-dependent methyltransferase
MSPDREPNRLAARYARRGDPQRYSMLRADVWHSVQERQRAMLELFVAKGLADLGGLNLVEVGCGAGGNLLEFLRLGLAAHRLQGVELLPERLSLARGVLPVALRLHPGDALDLALPQDSQDLVYVATVFSSLLDADYQQRLAHHLWRWVRPGGAVLWYDFVVDNPRNPDVRGVPRSRVAALFPAGAITWRRVTLAPPLARAAVRIHPTLYTVLNALPLLRTHALAWIAKPFEPT